MLEKKGGAQGGLVWVCGDRGAVSRCGWGCVGEAPGLLKGYRMTFEDR